MHAHTPHALGGDYVLPSARLEHSVVWLIRPGTLMDEYIQPANKFTQLQFGTGLMCLRTQRRMRSKCLSSKPFPLFFTVLKLFFFQVLKTPLCHSSVCRYTARKRASTFVALAGQIESTCICQNLVILVIFKGKAIACFLIRRHSPKVQRK